MGRAQTGRRAWIALTATMALLFTSLGTVSSAVAQESQPGFAVYPAEEYVRGGAFEANATVTVSLTTAGSSNNVVVGTIATDSNGEFEFDGTVFGADFGQDDFITVADGTTTKDTVVTALMINDVDPVWDTVSGTAAAGSELSVWMHDSDINVDVSRNLVADANGDWTADFGNPGVNPGDSGTADIVPGSNGNSSQGDGDGDATSVSWYLPDPRLSVETPNQIWSNGEWPLGASVTLTVDDDANLLNGTLYEASATVELSPGDNGFSHDTGAFVIEPGHIVTAVGPGIARELAVAQVDITGVNTGTETVTGSAPAGVIVEVNMGNEEGDANRTVTADGSGVWLAHFSVPAPEDDRTLDLQIGYGGSAQVRDTDGDATHRSINVPNPTISAETPNQIWSSNSDWTVGSTGTLTVDDPATPAASDYEATTVVEFYGPDPWNLGFNHETGAFVIEPGHVVTADDGETTKVLTVVGLEVTEVDLAADTVTGSAPAGAAVEVGMGNNDGFSERTATANGSGVWVADFSIPSPEDDQTLDLQAGYNGSAQIFDVDNDSTHRSINLLNPVFNLDARNVWGNDFIPNTQLSITLNGTEVEMPMTDEWGNFWVGYDQGVGDHFTAGDVVTVSDGVTTKDHTFTALTITAIDPVTDRITGTAALDSNVSLWSEDADAQRNVVADETTGVWIADFANVGPNPGDSGTVDLGPGSNGNSGQWDDDGDSTFVNWRVPNPSFTVDPAFDQVWGNEFEADTPVTIHLDGELVDTVTTDMWGNFNLNATTGIHDFVSPNIVDVSDGASPKSHEITPLAVTSVDVDNDTVTGVAVAGSEGAVWVHDTDAYRNVIANAITGIWVADFANLGSDPGDSGVADLVNGSNGNSNQCDDDGDCTQASWAAADPTITASVSHDEVWASNWPADPAGMLLYFQLDDPDTPEIDVDADMPLLVTQGGTEAGDRSFGVYDIEPEWVLTVRNRPFGEPLGDGIERQLVVSYLEVTDVDADLDTISGFADPAEGDRLCVWSNDAQLCSDAPFFTWNPDGTWVANFGPAGSDVGPGDWNSAEQYDADGDSTHFWWNLPPWVIVELAPEGESGVPLWSDAVRAEGWTGPTVTLTIERGGTIVLATDIVIDNPDQNTLQLPEFDVEPGDLVTLSDGIDTKSIIVESLSIDSVNFSTDTPPNVIYGTAEPFRNVRVDVTASIGGRWAERWVNATGSGDWLADFDNPGSGWREQWTVELGGPTGLGRNVRIEAYDDDNDRIETRHCEGFPRIEVSRFDNRVTVYDFPAGEIVTIEIDDPDTTESPDYIATGVSTPNPDNPCETIIVFTIVDYVIPEGATVGASDEDGTTTVVHQTIAFTIDFVDPDTETVTGTALFGTEVLVEADGQWRYPVANEFDVWFADFSTIGTEPGEQQTVDLQPGSSGRAIAYDAQGNTTELTWRIPNASFQVDPSSEQLWINEFEPNSPVTVTVNGFEVPGSPFGTDNDGNTYPGFDPNQLDLRAGDVVVVSDGTSSKDHTITDLVITGIDVDNDVVTGTSDAGSDVSIWVHGTSANLNVPVVAGVWTADFSGMADLVSGSNGNSQQCDDDNDCTQAGWNVSNPRFQVDPMFEQFWVNDFAPNWQVSITVNGATVPGSPFMTDDGGNTYGGFDPSGGIFEVGDVVVASDGDTTKTHTVTNLMVTEVDGDADVIAGTADPGVEVCIEGYPVTCRATEPDGTWSIFTNVEEFGFFDLQPGHQGHISQADDDSDATLAYWRIPNASFQVDPANGSIWANEFEPNAFIDITIDGVDFGPFQTDGNGNFDGNEFEVSFEMSAGSEVSITDGTNTKDHTVTNLMITDVNVDTDTISGTADANSFVGVWVHDSDAYLEVQVDEFGNWTADFSGMVDLVTGSNGNSQQCDDDNDCTVAGWRVANPAFTVETPQHVWSGGDVTDWIVGSTVTITVDDDEDIGNGVLFTGTTTVAEWGFYLDTDPFVIAPDHVVTVTNGDTTKVLVVTDIQITDVDVDADTVTGTAPPDTWVQVDVGNEFEGAHRSVQSNVSGNWTADFANPAPDQPEIIDLRAGIGGSAQVFDDDEDSTHRGFQVVDPVEIVSAVLTPDDPLQVGETIRLTIEFTGDANAAFVDWGDIVEQVDAGSSPIVVEHAYIEPGVYAVEATLVGHDGSLATASPGFAVVYDPDGGSISVNVKFEWPATAVPALAGEAKIGASAKYKDGEPTGKLKFEFKPDDGSDKLKFKEETIDTLVIASTFTYLRGTGMFEDDPTLYTFRLTAVDGGGNQAVGDYVRLVILDGSTVIWDTQPEEGAGAIPTTPSDQGEVKVRVN